MGEVSIGQLINCTQANVGYRRHVADIVKSARITPFGDGSAFQEICPRAIDVYDTASLAAFTGRALMIFRAGFALNIVGSFVNGLMPLRSCVAAFLMITNLANPGTRKAPVFLSSL